MSLSNTTDLPTEFQGARILNMKRGELCIEPGEGETKAWYIVEGIVRQYDILDDGSQYSLNIYKPGAVLALPWLFGSTPNSYYFEAHTDVTLAIVSADTYRDFVSSHPSRALEILERLSKGLDGYFRRLAINSKNNAAARILNEIRIENARFGNGEAIPVSIQSLTNRTGLARETVSRTVSKLATQGLVARTSTGHVSLIKP